MARAKAAVGDAPVELSWVKPPNEPSRVSSTNSQGWNYVVAAARADAPGAVVAPYLVVAATDSRSMEPISQDVYRFMPMHFTLDRKSTRPELQSLMRISYAVFCMKKKHI